MTELFNTITFHVNAHCVYEPGMLIRNKQAYVR